MVKITFYGAAGTVTGSRSLLQFHNTRMLIDCGLFQGTKENRLKNWESFPIPPAEIDRVFLTHAHIDHSGYLPRLYSNGFAGPVHCTHATADLCEILLKDSAHIQEEDAYWANKKGFSKHSPALPLYSLTDAEGALKLLSPLHYGEELNWGGLRIKFKDAGHILGSSFIDIKTAKGNRARKILFSGDIGRPSRPVLREPVQVYDIDYLILESTYGDRLHHKNPPEDDLARVISESVQRGGVLVIPSFAVGRTQTLLYIIRELEDRDEIPSLPIYLDSPMAIDATDIFQKRVSDQNLTSRMLTIEGKRVFHPKQLHLCRTRDQSKSINSIKSRAIIIASSGMATGGRILHHLEKRLPDPDNTILFTGFQVSGTRGRIILDGGESVRLHGANIPVRAKIENVPAFSGHADYNEILAWLMGLNKAPEKIFITHGEPEASTSLAEKIRQTFKWEVVIPNLGESFELDL